MDVVLDAMGISFVIALVAVLLVVTIIYAVIKKKKDYRPGNGIPKQVEKPERTQGSSKK